MNDSVEQFFREFMDASNSLDPEKNSQQFADVFVHSDPESVRSINNEDFVKSLPKRKAFFKSLGHQATTMEVTDVIEVGDAHVLAKTNVDMQFKKDREVVDLHQTASYLLKRKQGGFMIIAYINDQLLTALLVKNGLLNK